MKKSLVKSLSLLAATAVCAMGFTGCGNSTANTSANTSEATTDNASDSAEDTTAEAPANTGDVYKIGGMGPLTGDAASYGNSRCRNRH